MERYAGMVAVGSTRITFRMMPDGHVKNVRVVSNTSNDAFAHICIAAIAGGKYPPIPATVLKEQPHKWHDMDLNFKMFSR